MRNFDGRQSGANECGCSEQLTVASETFGDFFEPAEQSQEWGPGWTQEWATDADQEYAAQGAPEFFGGFAESPEWQALSAEGISVADVARAVFDELDDASDAEVDAALHSMTASMSPEEAENFWKSLGKIGQQVLPVAAPIIQAAAPIVGTAIGGPAGTVVGGLVGNLVGGAAKAVAAAPRAPRRARAARTRRQARRQPRRRTAQPSMRAISRSMRPVRAASTQLVGLLQNPDVQRLLMNLAANSASALTTARGESISGPAVLVALHGGIVEALRESQSAGMDDESGATGFVAGNFADAGEAFATLVAMLEGESQ